MKIHLIKQILLTVCCIAFLSACQDIKNNAHDWLIFRGDSNLSGYTDITISDNPQLLWIFKSNSYAKSSPIVDNNVAYWSDRRGHIFGVNIAGEKIFDYDLQTAVDATPMIQDSTLYIGRIDGFLSAISLTKKDTLWNFETLGQIAASPNGMNINNQNAIIIGSYDNNLYCVDSKTGALIKSFESGYYINGAVAQSDRFIVYGGCDGWVRIVDCISGISTDSMEVETYIPASPAIAGKDCYIADHAGNLYEIKIKNGKIVSSKKIIETKEDDNRTFVSVPAVSDKIIYIISDDRYVYAINRNNGTIAWKYLLKGDTGESSPVVCRDKVIACTKTGIVSILDATTGKLLWEYDTGEQIISSPAVISGYFYILTFKGTLFCFEI